MSTRTRGSTSSRESTGTRNHKIGPCKLENCNSKQTTLKLRNGKRLESRYCHPHTCKVGWGCEEPVRKTQTQYCKFHQTCAEEGCKAKGHNLTECASEWYCPKRKLNSLPRYYDSSECLFNTLPMADECRTEGCDKPQFPLHKHYAPPMPTPPPPAPVMKCANDGCNHLPLTGSAFCGNHKCMVKECPDGQHFPNGLCAVHQPCQAPGCREFGRWNLLRRHAERFCWQHEKCAMLTCGTVVGADDVLCPLHRCGLGNCKSEKYVWETRSNWCRVHTCGTKDCLNPIENGNYPHAEDTSIRFRHCEEHTCNRKDCLNEAAVELGPCVRHSCSEPTCNHNVYEPHIFCQNHECRERDCIEGSSPESHVFYCTKQHACRWKHDGASCANPRDIFGLHPDFCTVHSHRQSELNGAERGRREAEEQARTEAASGAPLTPESTPPRGQESGRREEGYRRRKQPQHERQRSPEWVSDDFSDGDPRYPPYHRQHGRWD
ncbi:hypothetical protein CC79DRAFT_6185 [Sarocladium strictum]